MRTEPHPTVPHHCIARHDRRIATVVLIAAVMVAVTSSAPASATGGGDDLEPVRATVKGTFDYAIGLLEGLRADTYNAERAAVHERASPSSPA